MMNPYEQQNMTGDAEPGAATGANAYTQTVQVPLCDKTVTTDLTGDFSLPDYQPEIRRLLRISAATPPPARYAGGNGIDLTGNVDYYVLYVGNDDQVYCAPLSAEYRMQVPFEANAEGSAGEPLVCVCSLAAEGAAGRVTAPRRLNIRCRVKAHAKVYGERELTCHEESGLVPGSVERLESRAQVGRVFCTVSDPATLEDDMILPPGNDVRVVCAEGRVLVSEATAGNGIVTCRGEVTLKLLLSPLETPTEPIETAESGEAPGAARSAPVTAIPSAAIRHIPFTVTVDCPGVTADCSACAQGACPELSVQVEEGRIHTDLGVVLEVTAQRQETVCYTGDLYSTRTDGECRFADCRAEQALCTVQGNFTLSGSMPLSEAGIEPGAGVVDMVATAEAEALTCDRGRGVLTGTGRFQLLLNRGGEWSTAELSLPFRYECEVGAGVPETPGFDGALQVISIRARMDGERIGLDAELAVGLRLTSPETLRPLAGISFGADVPRRRGEYVICFPSATDTLWSVAKRYHAPLTALAAANELPATAAPDAKESLSGVNYLIV